VSSRDVVRRLEAFDAGGPLPRGATLHLKCADPEDLLALAFLRMGGESLPWAIGLKKPFEEARIFAVPDARDRDRVAAMLVELTPLLAIHLEHPQWAEEEPGDEEPPLRQIWVPNGSHVELLHMLNLRYTFARGGDPDRAAMLRILGRMAGYLFREAGRAGESTIVDGSAALREAFTFPADDLRQQHLGFLIALLEPNLHRGVRMQRAEEAERLSVSTSLDPDFERDRLEPVVERYNSARRSDPTSAARHEEAITALLAREVERRLDLTLEAVRVLEGDAREMNAGAVRLAHESTEARQRDFLWLEGQIVTSGEDNGFFPPSPETDRDARTGAARYHRLSGGAETFAAALIHFDSELQEDAVSDGQAIRGTITKVEDRSPEGFRGTVPVWTIEAPSSDPTKFRRGSGVCVAGVPKRSGLVLDIGEDDGVRRVEVEINGWKRRPKDESFAHVLAAIDPDLEGTEIVLLSSSLEGISALKSRRVRDDTGPGAWLTHGEGTPPPTEKADGEAAKLLAELEGIRVA